MKKLAALIMISILVLTLVACKAPEDKLPEAVEQYISENYRITSGGYASEPVNVDVSSVIEMKEGEEWAVLGTYTVKLGNEILSAKFGLIATYNDKTNEFEFSDEEFDDFS